MQRSPPPLPQKQHHAQNRRDEPQQHINQIDPHRILHAMGRTITASDILMNVEFAEDAEDGGPEDASWWG